MPHMEVTRCYKPAVQVGMQPPTACHLGEGMPTYTHLMQPATAHCLNQSALLNGRLPPTTLLTSTKLANPQNADKESCADEGWLDDDKSGAEDKGPSEDYTLFGVDLKPVLPVCLAVSTVQPAAALWYLESQSRCRLDTVKDRNILEQDVTPPNRGVWWQDPLADLWSTRMPVHLPSTCTRSASSCSNITRKSCHSRNQRWAEGSGLLVRRYNDQLTDAKIAKHSCSGRLKIKTTVAWSLHTAWQRLVTIRAQGNLQHQVEVDMNSHPYWPTTGRKSAPLQV